MSKFKVGDIVEISKETKYSTVENPNESEYKDALEISGVIKVFGIRKTPHKTYYEIDTVNYRGKNYFIVEECYITLAEKKYIISTVEALDIIGIACDGWKTKLADKWGANIVLQKNIEVEETFVEEMFRAADFKQKKTLFKIFPYKSSKTLDEIKGELHHFSTNRDKIDAMIQVRQVGNLENQGYWLNPMFDWEMVLDNSGIQVLVPKKK